MGINEKSRQSQMKETKKICHQETYPKILAKQKENDKRRNLGKLKEGRAQ